MKDAVRPARETHPGTAHGEPFEWGQGRSWPQIVHCEYLPNVRRLNDRVYSGGAPDGEAGFRELSEMGVRTVLSVDGAQPELELARKFGLQYVHLPHGYDGIPAARATELAKVARDLPGPIYVHCHHGMHRSPAAAAVACIGAGLIDNQQGLQVLASAGTSEDYLGLFQSVESAIAFQPNEIDRLPASFPESAEVPQLAEAMVEVDQLMERLKLIRAAEWTTPESHQDLSPPHEALMLREHFTEILRTDTFQTEATQTEATLYRQMLRDSERLAGELEQLLRLEPSARSERLEAVETTFGTLEQNCLDCHRSFRDVPLVRRSTGQVDASRHR